MISKYLCMFILLVIIIYCLIKKDDIYISKSGVNGLGLFAGRDYKKGSVIIKNLFPHKSEDKILYNIIPKKDFKKYILKEGKYINHCSIQYNSDVTTNDKKIYKLIAIKDIYKGEEITSNYDKVNMSYPFIAKSDKYFNVC
jgi:SET domain-containing protein